MENNPNSRDDDLRNRFAALRREEEGRAPKFTIPSPGVSRGGSWHPLGKLVGVTVCLLTMTAVGVLWLRLASRPRVQPVASITDWKPPTDFLLETPGRELLRSVPAIGGRHEGAIAPKKSEKH